VTVVTEGKRERLIEKGVPAAKITVIPNGVDLGRFVEAEATSPAELRRLGLDPDRFLVVYAGIMNPPQGLDVLLTAARQLRAEAPDAAARMQFALVGGGSEQTRLEALVKEHALGDLVRFVAVQPRERIPSLLKAAGAVVVPLRPRGDDHTVPSKLYEAMASARPVVVSADGAPRKILDEVGAGIATAAGDVGGLTRSLRTLLERPELASAFGAQGSAYAGRFDRRELVSQLEDLLQSVAKRGRS
jgi:glycosyltransferase involved in cell wall biosynthesis